MDKGTICKFRNTNAHCGQGRSSSTSPQFVIPRTTHQDSYESHPSSVCLQCLEGKWLRLVSCWHRTSVVTSLDRNIDTYDDASQTATMHRRISTSSSQVPSKLGISTVITRWPSRVEVLSTIAYCSVEVQDERSCGWRTWHVSRGGCWWTMSSTTLYRLRITTRGA